MTTACTPIGLGPFTAVFVAFAVMLTGVNLLAEISNHVDHARTTGTIWVTTVLATPALAIMAASAGRPEGAAWVWWLLTWTFGLLAYWLHFLFAVGDIHGGSFASVVAAQGWPTAIYNFAVTLWWTVDVGLAWAGVRSARVRWQRIALAVVFGVGLFVAAVILKDGVVRLLGLAMLATIALSAFLTGGRSAARQP